MVTVTTLAKKKIISLKSLLINTIIMLSIFIIGTFSRINSIHTIIISLFLLFFTKIFIIIFRNVFAFFVIIQRFLFHFNS